MVSDKGVEALGRDWTARWEEGTTMPKFSMTTAANRWNIPGYLDAGMQELDGYSIEIESYSVDMDFAFAYKGLPNDQCHAIHLGYVLKGKLTLRMGDGTEEVFEAGDAYVITPGHVPAVAAGTEFVTFTPITEESKATNQVVQVNMMKYAQEHGIAIPS
jgi:hypothetical protein